jgi:hypothetical protein
VVSRRCVTVHTRYGAVRVQAHGEVTPRDIEAIEAVVKALREHKTARAVEIELTKGVQHGR